MENINSTSENPQGTSARETKTARQRYYQRMQEQMGENAKDIDWESDDEENKYNALLQFEDNRQKTLNGFKESNQKLSELFTKNPKFAAMLNEVMQGSDPSVAFIKYFGQDALNASDDEDKMKLITEANQEYLNSVAESEKLRKIQETNLDKSGEEMDAFQKEKGLNDEDFAKFIDAVYNVIEQGLEGLIHKDFLQIFWQGLNYEKDLYDAAIAGRIQGKNEKIELQNRTKTNGNIPDLHGKSASDLPVSKKPAYRSFYDN